MRWTRRAQRPRRRSGRRREPRAGDGIGTCDGPPWTGVLLVGGRGFYFPDSGEHAVLLDDLAIGRQSPALAQVADEVPVHSGRVAPAGLRIGAPEREVHRPADLLVEEDGADRPGDPEVRADPELAEAPRAVVGVEHLLEVVVAD